MNRENFQTCLYACWDCRHECQTVLFQYCLEKGEKHVKQKHVKLMMDCIEICQTSADFMTRHSDFHQQTCEVCALICDACAESCEAFDDDAMKNCAEMCRKCAKACREFQ